MSRHRLIFWSSVLFSVLSVPGGVWAQAVSPVMGMDSVRTCEEWLPKLPGAFSSESLKRTCASSSVLSQCKSMEGRVIFHVDHLSENAKRKKILVFGLIHGDEPDSGSLARNWLDRVVALPTIRNSWRVVPILNPDGFLKKTRTNVNGVDLNRNFPTKDWNETAISNWKKKTRSDPRRFPGKEAGSEKETQCAIAHIEDFKPDLIVSVHIPYRVIDIDGPINVNFPKFKAIPFQRIGHFPGSLGRYMWQDHTIPVVTVELSDGRRKLTPDEERQLQDILGELASRIETANGTLKPRSL